MEELVEKYKSIELKKRLIIVFFAALSYPSLVFFEEIEPVQAALDNAIAEELRLKSNYESAERTIANLPDLEKKLKEVNSNLDEARKYLPKQIEFDKILSELGRLEDKVGIQISSFSPSSAAVVNSDLRYEEIPINIELEGQFAEVLTYMDHVLHLKNLIHIKSLDIKRKNGGDEDNTANQEDNKVAASIQLNIFKSL